MADSAPSPDDLLQGAKTVILVPARYASSRFPGKPLIGIRDRYGCPRPLVQWSHRAASAVRGVDAVAVATDDRRIADVVTAFGGHVLMTPEGCANGTERVSACLEQLPSAELLINLQGDALLTPPSFVEALIEHMEQRPQAQVATIAVRCSADTFRHLAQDAREGRVGGTTVVTDRSGRALYFSKRILPYLPDGQVPDADTPILLHLGLYAYRRAALSAYVDAGMTMLERVEGLEQLRFLYAGVPVDVLIMDEQGYPIVEVNNPSDVPLVEAILASRAGRA